MRNFLQNVNIVGAVIMYRYFTVNEMCLNNIIKYCDRLVIMMDNYDENCQKKVLEFQAKHDNVDVFYSKIDSTGGSESGKMYRRLIKNINPIREQVLRRLEETHKKEKIDMFIHLDPDEMFHDEMPQVIEDFWKSEYKAMFCGMMTPFNGFTTFLEPSMYPHARIYKYVTEITSMVKPRDRDFYRPYSKNEAIGNRCCIFHLPQFDKEYRAFRDFRNGRDGDKLKEKRDRLRKSVRVYIAPKDARTMTRAELHGLLYGKPTYNFGEYLDKFQIDY